MNTHKHIDDQEIIDRLDSLIKNLESRGAPTQEIAASLPPLPSRDHLRTLLATAFWASLEKEEGRPFRSSCLYCPIDKALMSLALEHPEPLTAKSLVKLAPALKHGSRAICVGPNRDGVLHISGTSRILMTSLLVDVIGPGHIIVRLMGKNLLAYCRGVGMILENEDHSTFLRILALAFKDDRSSRYQPILPLAVSGIVKAMLKHGHGGTVLVVPAGESNWREHLASIRYPLAPPFIGLREDANQLSSTTPLQVGLVLYDHRQNSMRQSLEEIGQLTAVDGAVILDTNLEVHGFGAMIRNSASAKSSKVFLLEAGNLNTPTEGTFDQIGGSRHRSAAEFCALYPDSIAIVASQDGGLTVFGWLKKDNALVAVKQAERYLL